VTYHLDVSTSGIFHKKMQRCLLVFVRLSDTGLIRHKRLDHLLEAWGHWNTTMAKHWNRLSLIGWLTTMII